MIDRHVKINMYTYMFLFIYASTCKLNFLFIIFGLLPAIITSFSLKSFQ